MNKSHPLVSVCMVSYNQEMYVRAALDSVLGQKVSFPIEVIVSDDGSKDSTPAILQEYAEHYSGIVRPILNKINCGYPNNQRRSLEAAQGKYIALCDSDDYWTDPYKLQKQIDYLESHSECVICFHNVMHLYEDGVTPRSLLNPLDFPNELTVEDMILRKWFLPTNSEVFRREFLQFPDWYDSVLHIDYVINMLVAQHGTLHYIPDVMAVYRHTAISVNAQHNDGKWGYMLFHCQTMKKILSQIRPLIAERYHAAIDARLVQYDKEIAQYEYEVYCEKHFLARAVRFKTYKRIVRRFLKKKIG
ncbi:MAG: glycosyltransferase [Paludibacteraceae bacterium]